MESTFEIMRILLPLVIVGAIAVFVVKRLKHKSKEGTLGKKKSTEAQTILDSLIPLGMVFGSALAPVFSIIFQVSLSYAIIFGAGIGLLFGYFAYEFYSKKRGNES
ncbi:hypothetical protein DHX103_07040 [Planococcus sp. X10-3]|uniref:hypothetical protein n=1 Tax=Planococcus sp. X10-3 TaxID=3061240 RepID=UPI003BAEFE3D